MGEPANGRKGDLESARMGDDFDQVADTPVRPSADSTDEPAAPPPSYRPRRIGSDVPPPMSMEPDAPPPPDRPRSTDSAVSSPTSELATAFKDQLADAYLPAFGKVGGVLRKLLDHAWGASRAQVVVWALGFLLIAWLWNPILSGIRSGFSYIVRMGESANGRKGDDVAEVAGSPVRPSADSTMLTPAMLSKVAAPKNLKAELTSGQIWHFTWDAVPGVAGYNFYSAETFRQSLRLENKTKLLTNYESVASCQ